MFRDTTNRFVVAIILVLSVIAIGSGLAEPVTKFVNKALAFQGEAVRTATFYK